MSDPHVSVVIPCYNYGRYLGEAVESALNQTYRPVELVVIDDGSTDNTRDVSMSFGNRLKYYYQENQGPYCARNFALTKISGEYFVNLDADNRLDPAYVAKTLAFMREHASPDLAFVYTQMEFFGARTGISQPPEYDLQELKRKNYLDMCSLLLADIVKRFGFDPDFNEGCGDHAFYLTLAEHGYRGILLNEPLVKYRAHDQSITKTASRNYRQIELARRLIRKHRSLYTRSDAVVAMREAANKVLVSVIKNRNADAPLARRINDLLAFVRASMNHRELMSQIVYTFFPRMYFRDGQQQ